MKHDGQFLRRAAARRFRSGMREGMEAITARGVGMVAVVAVGLLGACTGNTEAERFYPLTPGRTWSYVMLVRTGSEPDERTIETSRRVTNLQRQWFDGALVTPQRVDAFGQAQMQLIEVSADAVTEVGTQTSPTDKPGTLVPPNVMMKFPLEVSASWATTWQSSQFAQTTLIPITKTVVRTDGVVSLPAGEFKDCVELSSEGRGSLTAPEGPVAVTVFGREWFAPDIGLVRSSFREEVEARPENATRVDFELSEFAR